MVSYPGNIWNMSCCLSLANIMPTVGIVRSVCNIDVTLYLFDTTWVWRSCPTHNHLHLKKKNSADLQPWWWRAMMTDVLRIWWSKYVMLPLPHNQCRGLVLKFVLKITKLMHLVMKQAYKLINFMARHESVLSWTLNLIYHWSNLNPWLDSFCWQYTCV